MLAKKMPHNRVVIKVNMHDAKTNLSRYVKQALGGETIVLCVRNEPVAEIRGIEPRRTEPRVAGQHKGMVTIHPSFFDPMSGDELAEWYGNESPA